MCFGSDLLGDLHPHQAREFELRGRVLPAAEVLRAATVNCAALFGWEVGGAPAGSQVVKYENRQAGAGIAGDRMHASGVWTAKPAGYRPALDEIHRLLG